jgi:hypothetical protein
MTFFFLFALLIAPPAIAPPHATIGDRVTITYPIDASSRVSIDESPDYDLISVSGNRVVLRSFKPGAFIVKARIEHPGTAPEPVETRVTIESVLAKGDKLQPAPLRPPKPVAMPTEPWKAIAIAALVAAFAWIGVWYRAHRKTAPTVIEEPLLAPDDEFRNRLRKIRTSPPADARWAELADAVRAYLARTRPDLGRDLTSSEIVRILRRSGEPVESTDTISMILAEADWVKFSPWSSRREDLAQLIERAERLVPATPTMQSEEAA